MQTIHSVRQVLFKATWRGNMLADAMPASPTCVSRANQLIHAIYLSFAHLDSDKIATVTAELTATITPSSTTAAVTDAKETYPRNTMAYSHNVWTISWQENKSNQNPSPTQTHKHAQHWIRKIFKQFLHHSIQLNLFLCRKSNYPNMYLFQIKRELSSENANLRFKFLSHFFYIKARTVGPFFLH